MTSLSCVTLCGVCKECAQCKHLLSCAAIRPCFVLRIVLTLCEDLWPLDETVGCCGPVQ
jgi:hypothetical protein